MEPKLRVAQIMQDWQRAVSGCAPPKEMHKLGPGYEYHFELLLDSCVPILDEYDDDLKRELSSEKRRLREEVHDALIDDLQDKLMAVRYVYRILAMARAQSKHIIEILGMAALPSILPPQMDDEDTARFCLDEAVRKAMDDPQKPDIELEEFVGADGERRIRISTTPPSHPATTILPPKSSMFCFKGRFRGHKKAGNSSSD